MLKSWGSTPQGLSLCSSQGWLRFVDINPAGDLVTLNRYSFKTASTSGRQFRHRLPLYSWHSFFLFVTFKLFLRWPPKHCSTGLRASRASEGSGQEPPGESGQEPPGESGQEPSGESGQEPPGVHSQVEKRTPSKSQ